MSSVAADSVLISSTEVTISGSEYQEFMLPLLRLVADGQEHTITDAIDVLAEQLGVSDSERDVMCSSGTQTHFYNRVTWALAYLTKSLLLENTVADDSRPLLALFEGGSEIARSSIVVNVVPAPGAIALLGNGRPGRDASSSLSSLRD